MSDRSSVIDTIERNGKFSTFAKLLRSSKAVDLLAGAGLFTVFAPTNDAFGKVPEEQMNGWLNQPDQTDLAKALSYHVVASKLFSSKLGGQPPATTLSGAEVSFSDNNGVLKVNDSCVQARNIEASNGIIHALDTMLTDPTNTIAVSAAAGAGSTAAPSAAAVTPTTTQADGHSDPAAATALGAVPTKSTSAVV